MNCILMALKPLIMVQILQTGIANPNLNGKTNTTEVGADMGFLDNRVNALCCVL